MTTIETTVQVTGQPPEVVAEALFAPENALQWRSNLQKFELLSGKPGEAGAKAHLYYQQKGRPHVMEEVLESAEPYRRYFSQVSGEGVVVQTETTLSPTPEGTQLTMRWTGLGASWWTRFLLRILRGAIADRLKIDLRNFKYLLETYGPRFPSV